MVEVRKTKGDTLEFHKVNNNTSNFLLYEQCSYKDRFLHMFIYYSSFLQFYKKLSTTLNDVVWKSGESSGLNNK